MRRDQEWLFAWYQTEAVGGKGSECNDHEMMEVKGLEDLRGPTGSQEYKKRAAVSSPIDKVRYG
jgi:hypothetical protein